MHQDELATLLAKFSEELAADRDVAVATARASELIVELIECCDQASISLRGRRGRIGTAAASSAAAEEYDALQVELGEGPMLETARSSEVCCSNDVARDPRWPAWGPRAAALGARSLVSVQLVAARTRPLGTINLYSHRLNAWGEEEYDLALLVATHTALALDAAHVVTGLRAALGSRHRIGVAQGILMARHDLTLDQSFGVLQRLSNDSNTKLSEVAAHIVDETDETDGRTDGETERTGHPEHTG